MLNTAIDADNRFPEKMIYMKLDLDDSPEEDIQRFFDKGHQFIEEAKKNKARILGEHVTILLLVASSL